MARFHPTILQAVGLALSLALAGCGIADSYSPLLPDSMRSDAAPDRLADPEPDVKQLVRDHLASVFATTPENIETSAPHRDPNGLGWFACMRANVTAATGRSIGAQTYLLSIDHGKISDRRLAEPTDNCDSEHYQPI